MSPAAASARRARSSLGRSIRAGASIISASCWPAVATWITANIASSRYGRALVAIRDAEVAAEASGIAKPKLLVLIFLLAGGLGGVAGGLFSSLQSYITPDAFTFEMSVLFFIAILDRGPGIHPGTGDRDDHPDRVAGVRRSAGAMVDLPLRRAAGC